MHDVVVAPLRGNPGRIVEIPFMPFQPTGQQWRARCLRQGNIGCRDTHVGGRVFENEGRRELAEARALRRLCRSRGRRFGGDRS